MQAPPWDTGAVPVSIPVLVVALAVTFAAALVQGTLGFGFAIVSVPVLSLLAPVLAPVPQLIMTMPLTLSMAWRERHAIQPRSLGWLLAGRIPGAFLGVLLLKLAGDRALDILIAGAVLVAVAILAAGVNVRRTPGTEFGAGITSGTMAMTASIGGPPVALLFRNDRGEAVRSNLATIFSVGIVITLTGRILAGEIAGSDAVVAALLFPGVLAGYLFSHRFTGRVEGTPLRIGILILSAVAAVGLLLRAGLG